MTKGPENAASLAENLRGQGLPLYRAPWKGQLLLACRKCRKKLERSSDPADAVKLEKMLKKLSKQDSGEFRLRVIEVPCLKLCPKGATTVCTQQQLGQGECSMVRTSLDVGMLYTRAKAEVMSRPKPNLNAEPDIY